MSSDLMLGLALLGMLGCILALARIHPPFQRFLYEAMEGREQPPSAERAWATYRAHLTDRRTRPVQHSQLLSEQESCALLADIMKGTSPR